MKTIDFSAFQLSKKEMNAITGGDTYRCNCSKGAGSFTVSNPSGHVSARLLELISEYCEGGAGSCKQA